MPNTRNNPTSGCDPTPHRPTGTTRKAFAAAAATRARCDPAYTNDDIAVRRHATFCQTLEAELDHALRGSGLDEFGIEYDRPLPMSAARRPSAHHATQNAAVMEEHTTIMNTPTELLLKGLRPIDKMTTPRIFSLGEAVTDLRNILDAVDPTHVGFEVEDTNVAAHHNLEEAAILPFMGMYIGDYAKVRRTSGVSKVGRVIDTGTNAGGRAIHQVSLHHLYEGDLRPSLGQPHSSPARHCQYLVMSSRGVGPALLRPSYACCDERSRRAERGGGREILRRRRPPIVQL
mmetsp:Transcript_3122/g.6212  ORF Transcript_3122/g.6212 Transcript_3122/m.6212 type:complete len:288 (-) Transcript_3122:344-1207(-)